MQITEVKSIENFTKIAFKLNYLDYPSGRKSHKKPVPFTGGFVLVVFFIFFSLFSFGLAGTFISLQIKEFRIMGLSINDSVYSSVFFFLTGLHFFHLVVGLLLLSLLSWSSSFSLSSKSI